MKASDSVNSLTELNPREVEEKTCFICLSSDVEQGEPLVDSKLLRNCGCKFAVHPACWNEWMKSKSDYDCPICHKASLQRIHVPPNPVLAISVLELRAIAQHELRAQRYSMLKCCSCLIVTAVTSLLITALLKWG